MRPVGPNVHQDRAAEFFGEVASDCRGRFGLPRSLLPALSHEPTGQVFNLSSRVFES